LSFSLPPMKIPMKEQVSRSNLSRHQFPEPAAPPTT
jgi:hypothetical protein